ncbi:521_t:CDS:10 [Funneliformis geosporum]|uniref:Nicastrin n=1 Tax=Funneliformis geosporum TaxID=1117311 RepID=A0A9W4WTJ6_9GLOM|nr:521_t:CDS:10 [Funneliformis geosporum]
MYINTLLKRLLLLSLLVYQVLSIDLADEALEPYIYDKLSPIACSRSLNSTSVIGCQSLTSRNGILILTKTQESLDDFISSKRKGKYIVILPYELMTNKNLRLLESSGKMSSVLALINGTDPNSPDSSPIIPRPIDLSPDEKCPNCQFDLYRNDQSRYHWNPKGLEILQESYEFPIFALYPYDNSSTITYEEIIKGANFNEKNAFENFPLKAAELKSIMFAAIDASTCLRRNWCYPIGGHSVYSTPSVDINENDGKPIIVVSAAMDSKSLFQDITFGLNNGISGSIALLAIADALQKSPTPVKDYKKHILFTLFSGESWGYSGSQRFVKDIFEPFECKQNSTIPTVSCGFDTGRLGGCTFPCFEDIDFKRINFNQIDSIFELSSVAAKGEQELKYFVHVDDENNIKNKLLVQGLGKLSAGGGTGKGGAGFVRSASEDGIIRKLPPSSSMAFLEKNRNIPSVVISDFQASLSNYNSEYDDINDLDVQSITTSICSIANVMSHAIWLHAQDLLNSANVNVPIAVNCTLVEEILNCLTVNYSCPLLNSFYNDSVSGLDRIAHSTRMFQYSSPSLLSLFHYNFLGKLNAVPSDLNTDCVNNIDGVGCCDSNVDCKFGEICINYSCMNSFTRFHHSYGIGLEFNDEGNVIVVDPEKATWVESISVDYSIRFFTITSVGSQIVELIFGILFTAFGVIGALLVKSYLRKTLKID